MQIILVTFKTWINMISSVNEEETSLIFQKFYFIFTGVYILQNTMARGGGNGAGEKNEKLMKKEGKFMEKEGK